MRRLISYLLTTICICLVFNGPALAGKTLKIAINPYFPPMEMKDKKGKVSGYEIDLMNAMAEAAGFQVKYVEVPWKDILSGLDKDKYDAVLASVSITEARKEKYDFSDPYFTSEQVFVVPKGKGEEPLKGKTIAAFKLTTGAEALRLYQKVSICFYTAEETEKAFRDLSKGFIDGVLCDSPVALDYAANNKSYKDKFATISGLMPKGVQIPKENYGIVVKKGNTETLDLINQALQSVRNKGLETQLKSRWIQNSELIACQGPAAQEEASLNAPGEQKVAPGLNAGPVLPDQGSTALDKQDVQKSALELDTQPASPEKKGITPDKQDTQKTPLESNKDNGLPDQEKITLNKQDEQKTP